MTLEPAKHTLQLTLLRHGRSLADDENVHEGRYDSPLTKLGKAQARDLAAYWQSYPPGFEQIVCSSLLRARETATIVAAALNLTPKVDANWMEFDNGPVAGLAFEEARQRYPIPTFRGRYEAFTSDGGESTMSFLRRAQMALETLMQSDFTNVLVVAHGGILNMALRDLLGASRGRFAFGDTAFARVVVYRNSDEAVLTGVNLQPHLDKG